MFTKTVGSVRSVGSKGACKQRRSRVSTETLELRFLFSGTWTQIATLAPGSIGTMDLLTDGSVFATGNGGGAGSDFVRLTPSNGSYINGTWTKLANANDTRLFDSTVVLQSGNVFLAGGEYGTGGSTGEVYNPLLNSWTRAPAQSYAGFSDAYSALLPNGNVLTLPVGPTTYGGTTIFNPTTNTWSAGPTLYRNYSADEQSWVKLADGSLLTVDSNTTSQRYIPGTNKFVNDGAVPVALSDSLYEYGPAFLLASGKAIFFGASGHSAIYTPSGSASPGSWVAGPDIPNGLGEDDAPGVELRDGTIVITAGASDSYNGPTSFFLYDPVSNTFSNFSGPNIDTDAEYVQRMLALPNGGFLYTEDGNRVYEYDPANTALPAAVPVITSLTRNSDGTETLTGTNLNGLNTGANYGDDAQMDTNYPIIRLTSGSNTYYARSYNWTNTGVQLASTAESVTFTLPLGIAAGTYSVVTTANGVPSAPTTLTISTTPNNVAPTIATAAQVAATVSTTTAALSVLGADDAGESNLIYTWVNTSAPSGASLAGFSANGTNAAKNTNAIFHKAGTYSFEVYVTDSGGLSVTSSVVTVVVTQTLTSVSLTPNPVNLTAGQSQQLKATGYDQFGIALTNQPAFTWALTSGAGVISSAGLYIAPSSAGTLAIVTASTGGFSGKTTIGVVNSPWTSVDIGGPSIAGIAYDLTSTTTVQGSGSDIWTTKDQFHYDYQTQSGDTGIIAQINAAPVLNTDGTQSFAAKAGVMFRNSTAANTSFVSLAYSDQQGLELTYRNGAGADAAQLGNTVTASGPFFVKLVRAGSVYSGYYSTNGTAWTLVGSYTNTAITTTGSLIGLVSCAHDNSKVANAVYSKVSFTYPQTLTSIAASPTPVNLTAGQTKQLTAVAYDQLGNPMTTQPGITWALSSGGGSVSATGLYTAPALGTLATVSASAGSLAGSVTIGVVNSPWISADIGGPTFPGIAYDSGANTTLNGSGNDIWSTADEFHYDYQNITGNAGIIVRINSTPTLNTDSSTSFAAKAGVMFRDSTSATASFVDLVYTNQIGLEMIIRNGNGTGASVSGNTVSINGPFYIRLIRSGTTFTGYYSTNLSVWTLVASYTNAAIGNSALVGLVACSHDDTKVATVTYSNAAISQPTVATAASAAPNPDAGTTVNLSVLGANLPNSAGESSLSYSWAATAIPNGAPAPGFSINGTNAAKNTVATQLRPGIYGFTVTITDTLGQAITSSVVLSVIPTSFAGGAGADTFAIRLSPTNAAVEQIFINVPESASPTYTIALDQLPSLTFAPTGGDGSLTIDFSNGNPLPSGGVNYTGGSNPTPTGNALYFVGTSSGSLAFSINAAQVTASGSPSSQINYSSLQKVEFDLSGGNNTLTQIAQPSAALTYNAGTGANTLNVNGGSFVFSDNPKLGSGNLTVNDNASVNFTAPATNSSFNQRQLAGFNLGPAATATLSTATAHSDRTLLIVGSLVLDSTATLDLGGNDMDITGGVLSTLTSEIAQGYNGNGDWLGNGITSTMVSSDSTHTTALGVITNADANGLPLYATGTLLGTFDGYSPLASDTLIKFTYYGDTDLSGTVDGSDYSRIDTAYLVNSQSPNKLTGWGNGDLNYDQTIDGSDYTLMDNLFNTQADPLVEIAGSTATSSAKPLATISAKQNRRTALTPAAIPTSNIFAGAGNIGQSFFSDDSNFDILHAKTRHAHASIFA